MNDKNIIKDEITKKSYILDEETGRYYKIRKFNGFFAVLTCQLYAIGIFYMIISSFKKDYKAKAKFDFLVTPAYYIFAFFTDFAIIWLILLLSGAVDFIRPLVVFVAIVLLIGVLLFITVKFRFYFYEKAIYNNRNGKVRESEIFYSILPYINNGYITPCSLSNAIIAVLINGLWIIVWIIGLFGNDKSSTSGTFSDRNGNVYSFDGHTVRSTTGEVVGTDRVI